MIAGVVLAGGDAARFGGGDKTLAEVDGVPILVRAVQALADAEAREVLVASRHAERASRHLSVIKRHGVDVRVRATEAESTSGAGPLAGVLAAAHSTVAEWLAIAPGDAPFLSPALYELLAERAREHGTAAAFEEDGEPHPLLAVVNREALLRHAGHAWGMGERSPRRVLQSLGYVGVMRVEAERVDPGLRSLVVVHAPGDVERLGGGSTP